MNTPDKAAFLLCWIHNRLGNDAMREAEAAWQWRLRHDDEAKCDLAAQEREAKAEGASDG